MPYRRTENVVRRLAARQAAIVAAARAAASEGGMAAVQIVPVAARAGIAAGTVYRYFPGKTDLVTALLAQISEREIGALRRAADVAPGPLAALRAGWRSRSRPSSTRRGFLFVKRSRLNSLPSSRQPSRICRSKTRR